jgi:hypothetical protein
MFCPSPKNNNLRTSNPGIIIIVHVPYAVLRNNLYQHPFKINRQSSLQLICAHPQNLDSLLEIDIRVVVLVEDGEAVVLCVAVSSVGKWSQGC